MGEPLNSRTQLEDSPGQAIENAKPKGWGSQIYDGINNAAKYVDKKLMGGYDQAIKDRKSFLSFDKTSSGRISIISLNPLIAVARATISATRFVASTVKNAVACVAYGTYHAVAAIGHAAMTGVNTVQALGELAGFGLAYITRAPEKERTIRLQAAKEKALEAGRHLKETVVSTAIGGVTVAGVGLTVATAGVAVPFATAALGVVGPVVGPAIAKVASPALSHVDKALQPAVGALVEANKGAAVTQVANATIAGKSAGVAKTAIVATEAAVAATVVGTLAKNLNDFKKKTQVVTEAKGAAVSAKPTPQAKERERETGINV